MYKAYTMRVMLLAADFFPEPSRLSKGLWFKHHVSVGGFLSFHFGFFFAAASENNFFMCGADICVI